jgi:hypothetical protein
MGRDQSRGRIGRRERRVPQLGIDLGTDLADWSPMQSIRTFRVCVGDLDAESAQTHGARPEVTPRPPISQSPVREVGPRAGAGGVIDPFLVPPRHMTLCRGVVG